MTKKIFIIVMILALCVVGYFVKDTYFAEESFEGATYIDGKKHVDLVGTGMVWREPSLAWNANTATHTPATSTTMYQYASSTNENWWTNTSVDFPYSLYGATTTSYFRLGKADIWTLNGFFNPLYAGSKLTIELSASDSNGCDNTTIADNTAFWYPMPISATTTESALTPSNLIVASTTITLTAGGRDLETFSIPFTDINYQCVKVVTYNSSTTDDSLLWLYATVRDRFEN